MDCIILASLRTDKSFNLKSVSEKKVNLSAVQVLVETSWPSNLAASRHTCISTAPRERYQTKPRAVIIPAGPSVAQVTSQNTPYTNLTQTTYKFIKL